MAFRKIFGNRKIGTVANDVTKISLVLTDVLTGNPQAPKEIAKKLGVKNQKAAEQMLDRMHHAHFKSIGRRRVDGTYCYYKSAPSVVYQRRRRKK